MEVPPVKDRSHWRVKKFDSFDEMRKDTIQQWQLAGVDLRLQAAWELVYDYWVGMKEMHPDELRLQRTVTSIQRTQG